MEAHADLIHRLGHRKSPRLVLVHTGSRVLPKLENRVHGVASHLPVFAGGGVEPEDLEIPRETTRTHTPVESPVSHMVQLGDTVGDDERVVVGHAADAGAEDDVLRLGQGVRDEEVWGWDVLPNRGEVLAYPRLLVPKLVERNDLFQVVIQGLRDV